MKLDLRQYRQVRLGWSIVPGNGHTTMCILNEETGTCTEFCGWHKIFSDVWKHGQCYTELCAGIF
jgi:hypothetical protein